MKEVNSITVDRYYESIMPAADVGIGILDISRDIPNATIQKRTFDMTYFYINRMMRMGLVRYLGQHLTVDEILEAAAKQNLPYCMVACQGLLLFRGPSLVTQSRQYAERNPEFFVVGHIMNKKNKYPGLHRQYLFVNVQKWIDLGKPVFDEMGYFADRSPILPDYSVSESVVHSEYTPLWIESGSGEAQKWNFTNDGSNWILTAIRNNIKIDNLDNNMRESKVFLYPYSDSELLARAWYDKDKESIDKLSDYSQRAWLRKLQYQEQVEKNRVYAFNTETLSGEGVRSPGPIDAFFSAAAGFKPLSILQANGFHDNTVVHYFDWCQDSLDFKKRVIETWDGIDFHKWLLAHDLEYNFSSTYRGNYEKYWKMELEEFDGAEKFKELWDKYKELDHHFHLIDIVNEPEKLFDIVKQYEGNKAIWTTNIWSSEMLHWNEEPEIIEQKWLHFEQQIPDDLILYGHDYLSTDMKARLENGRRTTHPRFQTLYPGV